MINKKRTDRREKIRSLFTELPTSFEEPTLVLPAPKNSVFDRFCSILVF
jgi:hypothetical protein